MCYPYGFSRTCSIHTIAAYHTRFCWTLGCICIAIAVLNVKRIVNFDQRKGSNVKYEYTGIIGSAEFFASVQKSKLAVVFEKRERPSFLSSFIRVLVVTNGKSGRDKLPQRWTIHWGFFLLCRRWDRQCSWGLLKGFARAWGRLL